MAVNLLALCKNGDAYVVKRVKTTSNVQDMLEGIFAQQEQDFFEGISEEVLFDGGWNPEKNELLYVETPQEAQSIIDQAQASITSLPELDAAHFSQEGIKALSVTVGPERNRRLLIQNFSARQILQKSFSLILDGDTFSRLTQPTFSVGTALSGVVEGGRLKFKSYNNVKMIFELKHLYKEATDAQIDVFASHGSIMIENIEAFKDNSDQQIRKLVNAVSNRNILDTYIPDRIVETASLAGLTIDMQGGKIIMPSEKKALKAVLHFLDDAFYKAVLSDVPYIANSKRRFIVP